MTFSKEEYWKRRNNTVKQKINGKEVEVKKPLRGQGEDPKDSLKFYPSDVEHAFDRDGKLIAKNRAYRRKRTKLNVFKRKGFIERLNKIRITRKNKSGNVKVKYISTNLEN